MTMDKGYFHFVRKNLNSLMTLCIYHDKMPDRDNSLLNDLSFRGQPKSYYQASLKTCEIIHERPLAPK